MQYIFETPAHWHAAKQEEKNGAFFSNFFCPINIVTYLLMLFCYFFPSSKLTVPQLFCFRCKLYEVVAVDKVIFRETLVD